MAVQDENKAQQPAAATAFGAAAAAPRTQQTQAAQAVKHSWRGGLGAIADMPMGRNPSSEAALKIDAALTKIYTNANTSAVIKTFVIDRANNPAMGLSVVVVAMHMKDQPKLGVAYHTLLIEASQTPFESHFPKVGNTTIEVKRVASDAYMYDDNIRRIAWETVGKSFPGIALIDAGACVVPRCFNTLDEHLVYGLAANALIACNTNIEINKGAGFRDFTLVDMQPDSSLAAKVLFHNQQSIDAVGLPVRSDISITFQAGGQQQAGQPMEQPRPITEVNGYMDIVYESSLQQSNQYLMAADPTAPTASRKTYVSHFIITNLLAVDLQTLPAQLLALVTISVLRENNVYTSAFQPRVTNDAIDLRDIGAIGLEVNKSQQDGTFSRFDTKSDQFRPENFGQMLAAFFHPGMMVSIDVADAGALSWCNDVFSAAARNVPEANQALIAAANYLTNDNFGRHYALLGGTGQPLTNSGNKIHMGYYINRQGERRDIREIDYLAILNLFPQDPSQIALYSNSHLNRNMDLQQRLAERWKLYEPLNPTLTGMAERCTFETKYLEALMKGCIDMKLTMRPLLPHTDNGHGERVAGGFSGAGSVLLGGTTGMFSSVNSMPILGQGNNLGGFSRWQR